MSFSHMVRGQFSLSYSTGKERDEETGYGYFGARYMDYELMTMWLSVDPMADKYPSISPYSYCAWNPVKLVDPDGEEIEMNPYLIFNGAKRCLQIWDDNNTPDTYNDDTFIGEYEAANNTIKGCKKWPDGIYSTDPDFRTKRHTHSNLFDNEGRPVDSPESSYGAGGIYQATTFTEDDGTIRTGMGIHAGRENKGNHPWDLGRYTKGCIRTTSDAMNAIDAAIKAYGPLVRIIIQNNRTSSQSSNVNSIEPSSHVPIQYYMVSPIFHIDNTYVFPLCL